MKKTKRARRFEKYIHLKPTLQVGLAVTLFIVAVLVSRQNMTEGEILIFHSIYGLPAFLLPFFLFTTQLGSIYMLAVLLAVYIINQRYHVVLRLLLTGTLAYQLAGFAKDLWGTARPYELMIGVVSKDYIVRGPGFPSGHMALAVALALTIGHYLPRKYYWMVAVWIVGVALSRIYLGIHTPMDIIGGSAIGWFSYALFRHVRLHDIGIARKRVKKA